MKVAKGFHVLIEAAIASGGNEILLRDKFEADFKRSEISLISPFPLNFETICFASSEN